MQTFKLLQKIHPVLLKDLIESLVSSSGYREELSHQLNVFLDLLEEGVETKTLSSTDAILSVWSDSLTQADLEIFTGSLTQFVNQIIIIFTATCRKNLETDQALALIETVLPYLTYASEKGAQYEIQARIKYSNQKMEQIQQNLERLDRSKSDFISVAAHELKTPLTLIEGYTDMIQDGSRKSSADPFISQFLEGIHKGIDRLRVIINDMIDASLIDNNSLELNYQPLWLDRLFEGLRREFNGVLIERRLNLIINKFPGIDELTYGDPERLLQVFRNIFTNAIKYTPDGGNITVYGRKLPGFTEVMISDTGIGISQEDQIMIFDKFARLGKSSLHSSGKTKFKGGGPGLGLHIARGIIEAHGGTIWVESSGYDETSYPGSTFHLLLPILTESPNINMAKIFAPLNHISSETLNTDKQYDKKSS
jgi:signal transduction histidine kinase